MLSIYEQIFTFIEFLYLLNLGLKITRIHQVSKMFKMYEYKNLILKASLDI